MKYIAKIFKVSIFDCFGEDNLFPITIIIINISSAKKNRFVFEESKLTGAM
jgi:hypothetical protein